MQEIWEGDSRVVGHQLPEPINCVIADPPYGANFVSRKAETPEGKRWVAKIDNDANLDDAIRLFHEVMAVILPKLALHADLYVFTRWDIVDAWMAAVRALPGISYKMLLVWDKGYPGLGDIDANWGCGHELILYCKKGRRDVRWRRSSIIHVDKMHTTKHIHPTEKPVELLEYFIAMSTNAGDLVVDPFGGSGSTAVAAQRLGRNAICIEQKAQYVQASRNRLGNLVMDI